MVEHHPRIISGLVSVIIPCYQHAYIVTQAIDSVLNQTYPHFEIIIINDGSTDNTDQVLQPYLAKYSHCIRYIKQENQGQSKARRVGIKQAKGEFYITLDADDLLEPQMMEKCVQALQAAPEAVAVAGNVWMIDEKNEKIGELQQNQVPTWPEILIHNGFGGIAGIMLRSQAIAQIGGIGVEGLPGAEDWDLWIRMARAKLKIIHISEYLGRYRQSSQSHSRCEPLEVLIAKLKMLESVTVPDPRLSAIPDVYPPIDKEEAILLRNKFVFASYGLAAAAFAEKEQLITILNYLDPTLIDSQQAARSFFGGVRFYNLPRQVSPSTFDTNALSILETYLQDKGWLSQSKWQALLPNFKEEQERIHPTGYRRFINQFKQFIRSFIPF